MPGAGIIRGPGACGRAARIVRGAAVGAALSVPALADPAPAIETALDRFQSACALALTDPDAYVASLALPGPSGEPGAYPSPDGQYLLVHTAQSEGLTDFVEFAGLNDRLVRRCSISAVLPGFPEAATVAALAEPLLRSRASEVVGGEVQQVTPIWEPGDTAMVFEADPRFVFHATGLVPGIDEVATVMAQSGGLDMSVATTVAGAEVIQ